MKFVKYNDNKSVTIPPAVLTSAWLDDEGSWKWPRQAARSFCQRAR